MTVSVILPTAAASPCEIVRQQVEAVHTHFAGEDRFEFFCPAQALGRYRTLFPDISIEPMQGQEARGRELVVCESLGDTDPRLDPGMIDLRIALGVRVSSLYWYGRLMPVARRMDAADLQNIDAHVFNRLSPETAYGFYYFPYGYLFRFTGMGPIDKFGFRITHDVRELAKRPRRHKVVACFGGSAAWSLYCLPHQMYTTQLERRLNAYCRDSGSDVEFTVLNFGQHAHMVMNEMLTYMLYCWELKPDVVVAHDGYNDIVYGQICDPRLLNDWAIGYQENLEGWSQILHETSQHARTQPAVPYRAVNQPVPVLKAYTRRKRQFADMVRGHGGVFIWGLQPAECSRTHRGSLEARLIALNSAPDYAAVLANVEGMYRMLTTGLRLDDDIPFVDCHRAFASFGADVLLLGDHVHLMPEGDRVVADLYADAIIDRCLKGSPS